MVGIDDEHCCLRVQKLLQAANVQDTEAFYYAPPTKEETAAYLAMDRASVRI